MVDMNNKLVQASIHQSKSILSTLSINVLPTDLSYAYKYIFACMNSKTLENCKETKIMVRLLQITDNLTTLLLCVYFTDFEFEKIPCAAQKSL